MLPTGCGLLLKEIICSTEGAGATIKGKNMLSIGSRVLSKEQIRSLEE